MATQKKAKVAAKKAGTVKEKPVGHKMWLIPDGYLPVRGSEALVSHESICVLNTGTKMAHCALDVYFEDRPPMKGIRFAVAGERTSHVRLDKKEMLGGTELPQGVPFSYRITSDVPVVIQCSRLDVTQPNLALFTAIGFPVR